MIKNLTRHGNSFALVIDRAILELIHAGPETPFEIITDGNSLVLTPVRDVEARRNLETSLQLAQERIEAAGQWQGMQTAQLAKKAQVSKKTPVATPQQGAKTGTGSQSGSGDQVIPREQTRTAPSHHGLGGTNPPECD